MFTLVICVPLQTSPATGVGTSGVIFPGVGSVMEMANTDEFPVFDNESILHWLLLGGVGTPGVLVEDTRKMWPPQLRSVSVARIVFEAGVSMLHATSTSRFEYCTDCPL